MVKIALLIPARGGSKRLPRKNIMNLNGMPLIDYVIKTSLNSNVDETWVSTEDKEIKNVALKCGALVIERPNELATDTTSTEAVIEHFLDNIDCEILVLCECTQPLLNSVDINQSIKKFFDEKLDSLVTLQNRKLFLWKINEKNGIATPSNFEIKNRPRTQVFDGVYSEDCGLWITSKNSFNKSKVRVSGKIGYHIIDHPSIEIDNILDFKIAEALLKD